MTDRHRVKPPGERSLVRLVERAAIAGVGLIQIRERDLDDRRLLGLTRAIVESVAGSGAAVVVNDRVDVALAGAAHGVHLRADSPSADRIRPLVPGGFLIGRSVHTPAEADAAARTAVDYLMMGSVYPTTSKPDGAPVLGLAGLEQACRDLRVPVLAIGGVVTDKVWDVTAAGAAGVAAIGLFADVPIDDSDERLDATLSDLVAELRRASAGGPVAR